MTSIRLARSPQPSQSPKTRPGGGHPGAEVSDGDSLHTITIRRATQDDI